MFDRVGKYNYNIVYMTKTKLCNVIYLYHIMGILDKY